jgi:putative NADPH-quinone reductase
MKRRVLIIHGHPVADTFSEEVTQTYIKGLPEEKAEYKLIYLRDLDFELDFKEGYRGNQELEKDLKMVQDDISWADHLVFIYPNWWGTFPALVKGFIDRTFLPGFAFKYRENSLLWDKLLEGKSARVIVTMDSPPWYYKWIVGAPGHKAMKKGVLEFCGVKPVRLTTLGSVKKSTEQQRNKWLNKIKDIAGKMI